jgi:hypothetical protein
VRLTALYQRALVAASELTTHIRQEITDADGNWRDVSNAINGPDFLNHGSIDETLDGNSQQFSLSLLRDAQFAFQVLDNPEFAAGSLTNTSAYDNGASGSVTLATESFANPYNRTGYRLKITHSTAGTPSPGWGGINRSIGPDNGTYQQNKYHVGATLIWKVIADIPIGYSINFASNATGTGSTNTWLTTTAGQGVPFEYILKLVIGATGTFATTGYFWISGGARPLTWYVYSIKAIDEAAPISLAPLRTDTPVNRNAAGNYAPMIDVRRKWRTFCAVTPKGVPPSVSRGNLIIESQRYDQAAWTKRGTCTVTANAVTAPDGTLTADTIAGVGVAGNDIFQSVAGLVAGARYEPSFWVQRISTGDTIIFSNPSTAANGEWRVNLDLLGPGWVRVTRNHPAVTIIAEFTANAGVCGHFWRSLSGSAISFNLWGSQLEPGTISTGYIPTTTAAITAVNDWEEMGNGFIDRIDIDDSTSTINYVGRDAGAVLLDAYIRTKRSYGSVAGTPIATVLQSVINDNAADNGYSGITLTVDASAIAFLMNPLTLDEGNLMQGLNTIAGKAGMVVRFRYNSSDVLVLTLYSPNRAPSVEDWSIGPTEYLNIPINSLDIEGVRNLVILRYFDTAAAAIATVQSPTSGTSASITKYGIRPLFIDAAADSGINTATKAQLKADAVRLDLETPSLEQQIESYALWFAQLGDYVKLLANGVHYDSDQFGGVVSIHHDFGNGAMKSTIGLKGKPAGRYRTWLAEGATDSGATAPTPEAGSIAPPIARVTQSAITAPTLTVETLNLDGTTGRGAAADLLLFTRWRVIDSRTGLGTWSAWVNNTGVNTMPLEAAVTRGGKWEKTFEFQVRDELGQVATDSRVVQSTATALNDSGVVDDGQNMSSGAPPFRKTIDTTAGVVSVSTRGFIDQGAVDVSLRPTSIFRGAGYEPSTNLFKRGTDSASDVVITSTRTFVDPNSATQVDASGRIVGVYRLGVYEPVNNLVKVGDSLGAVTASSITLNGSGAFDVILSGSPTTVLQIAIGDSSVFGTVGTLFSSGAQYHTYNAYQTTKSADSWNQSLGTLPSTMLLISAGGIDVLSAVAGRSAGTLSAFWGSSKAYISAGGGIGGIGQLRMGSQVGSNGISGDVIAARGTTTGAYYYGNSSSAYTYFDGTWLNLGGAFAGLVMGRFLRGHCRSIRRHEVQGDLFDGIELHTASGRNGNHRCLWTVFHLRSDNWRHQHHWRIGWRSWNEPRCCIGR